MRSLPVAVERFLFILGFFLIYVVCLFGFIWWNVDAPAAGAAAGADWAAAIFLMLRLGGRP